jgi:hypothetical protein
MATASHAKHPEEMMEAVNAAGGHEISVNKFLSRLPG